MKFIGVSGFGWSGSGAVVDLVSEFENCKPLDVEFRLIKDPYGISDLESFLVEHWDILRSDKAIGDFIWFCSILNMKGSKLSRVGENLSQKLSIDFMKETQKYIDTLTNIKYSGYSMIFNYHLSATFLFFNKIMRKLGLIPTNKKMYLARPTKEKFIYETQIYLSNIFKNFIDKNKINTIILDQAISITNLNMSMRYFKDIKLIIVDRDPRDIYVDLVHHKALVGADSNIEERPKRFVEYYNLVRSNLELNKNTLKINFEDLILNYEDEVKKIKFFLGNTYSHVKYKKYFNPSISIKNIGIWKNFQNQSEIDYIYNKLKNKCYDI